MIEVWYRGARWDGIKPEPVKIGEVATTDGIGPLVLAHGGGMCSTAGDAKLQGCYFADAPSKSCDVLRDLLAILQDGDKWNPDPAGCLAQAISAGIAAVKHDLAQAVETPACDREHVDELECHCSFFKTGGTHESDCDFMRIKRTIG